MPYLFRTKEKPDILFSPSHYTVPVSTVPRVCAIMDLGYLNFSDQFEKRTFWQLKYWTAISIIVSKRIIAISNATKNDIVRHYPFARNKVSVTYLAYDNKRFNTLISNNDVRRVLKKYTIVNKYLLYLGTLKPSKNLEGILDAFALIKISNGELLNKLQLVIAGKKGWMYDSIYKRVEKLGLSQKVVFTDYVSEGDKAALLAGATLFLAPSFWEGFGLHVLESLACGTPVLVSGVGSLPEVVGKAGVFVETSPCSIADGIKKVLKMKGAEYNNLVDKGLKQASFYTWEATARKTVDILEKTIK